MILNASPKRVKLDIFSLCAGITWCISNDSNRRPVMDVCVRKVLSCPLTEVLNRPLDLREQRGGLSVQN